VEPRLFILLETEALSSAWDLVIFFLGLGSEICGLGVLTSSSLLSLFIIGVFVGIGFIWGVV
jgi:hypothetical protein